MKTRKENGEGSCRKLGPNEWECIIQSKYINPKTITPKRIKRKGKTEKEAREKAQQALLAWEKQIINYSNDFKENKSKTFGEYMVEYMTTEVIERVQDGAYHSYYNILKNQFLKYNISKMQLHMLNVKVFEEYYNEMAAKYSKKTCATPIQWCRQLCSRLVDKSLLRENYALQAQPKKEVIDEYNKEQEERLATQKKIFTLEDIEKFYEAYKQHNGEYARVVMFILETGLRISEFASLRNSSIDFDKRIITIKETRATRFKDKRNPDGGVEEYNKVPKNKKTRIIYMSDLLIEIVKEMQEQTKLYCKNNPQDLLYPTFRTGNRRSNSSAETCFKDLCNKIGVDRDVRVQKNGAPKGLSYHALRDTMSSLSKSMGTSTSSVALMLGHSERVNESHYTFANTDVLKQVKTPSQLLNNNKEEIDEDLWKEFLEFKKWKEEQGK
jgi:integrase